jgi:Glycosyl hydrolase catalytic core
MPRRPALALLVVLLALLGTAAPASASFELGINDYHPETFADPNWKPLGVHQVRVIIPWDTMNKRSERTRFAEWMQAARHARVEPFVTFDHSRGCTGAQCVLPSPRVYRSAVRKFLLAYPEIYTYAPWNEINHVSQPTAKRPDRAAQYYETLRDLCLGCTVVAADILDQPKFLDYAKKFMAKLDEEPTLWGLHNYLDTNRRVSTRTRQFLATVPGEVWFTETGGIVQFGRRYPYDPERAASAVSYTLRLAGALSTRVKRVYLYTWLGEDRSARFDAGLVDPDGRPRRGYYVVRDQKRSR